MKHLKKLAALLLAVVMTMAMSMTAFAADATTYTLTLTGTTTGHTYEAYQIFKGDLKDPTLSNIKWGSGVDPTKNVDSKTLIDALKADDTLKGTFSKVTDAASVAEALSKATDNDAVSRAFATVVSQYLSDTKVSKQSADKNTEISDLTAGYYLVKDQDNSLTTIDPKTQQDAYTRFILKVVANTFAAVKSDVPTVEKKVKDTNDSDGTTTDWQDSADYDVNDWVPYQITGTMPSNIADYTTYKYEFTDTMSKGLTYDKDDATHKAVITIYKNASDTNGTVVTGKFKENVGTADATTGATTVTWTCDDLKKAGVDLTADSKVVVTYYAKLNDQAVIGSAGNPNTVYLTYSNNPNRGGVGNTGKTPEDKNIVFTYKVVVNKVAQNNKPLEGAAFELQKKGKDGQYTTIGTTKAGTDTTFTFERLDDGDYKLIETTTPAGYNTIDPVEFTISATHSVEADDPKLLTLSGTDSTGEVTFAASENEDKSPNGTLTTDIVNKKGSTLPSTGGVGTHMFYVFGGCLVAAAVVLLALKKRKEA